MNCTYCIWKVKRGPHEPRMVYLVVHAVFGTSVHVNKVTDLLKQPLSTFQISRLKEFIVSILSI